MSRAMDGQIAMDVHVDGQGSHAEMASDALTGLTADQKHLLPKYFYDDHGSDLFEQITALPEYYPTRAERALLGQIAEDLMHSVAPVEIVELGSGSSAKTRVLLSTEAAAAHLRRYVPFDVSEGIVQSSARELQADYPFLSIHGVIGDFDRHLGSVPQAAGRRLVLFLGGTIGNFDPSERVAFLRSVRELLGPDDRLLIGVDLVKEKAIIEAAYNDSAGVTAEFNRNVLHVLNRDLGADFDPEAFEHTAFFNEQESRIEMHLVPMAMQSVRIRDIGLTLEVGAGESIWTESSYKFTKDSVAEALAAGGLELERFYTNAIDAELFGLVLAKRV
jgi:L-histidine N-alpha-methyltransferase